jgi:hypothetical protein
VLTTPWAPSGFQTKKEGTRWLHHEGIFAKRAFGSGKESYLILVTMRGYVYQRAVISTGGMLQEERFAQVYKTDASRA